MSDATSSPKESLTSKNSIENSNSDCQDEKVESTDKPQPLEPERLTRKIAHEENETSSTTEEHNSPEIPQSPNPTAETKSQSMVGETEKNIVWYCTG